MYTEPMPNQRFTAKAASRSVRQLKELFRGRRKKALSINEMNAVIEKRASGSR